MVSACARAVSNATVTSALRRMTSSSLVLLVTSDQSARAVWNWRVVATATEAARLEAEFDTAALKRLIDAEGWAKA